MGALVDDEAVEREAFVVALEAVVVLAQSAEVGFCDLLYLLLGEGRAVEAALGELLAEGVAVLPLEDEEVALLVGAVAGAVEVVVGA